MWAQIINTALGIWLMAAPAVLGYAGPARTDDRIVGPLAASIAAVAISGVTRPVRRLNWLVGAWLLIAPWVLGFPVAATVNSMVIGVLLIVFASIRGTVSQRYGGGWSAIWSGNVAQGNREGV
jgi:hypothetical protein